MISKSTQTWTAGATVKVGFLSLVVVAAIATPGDYAPDAYILKNAAGTQLYRFRPHLGVEKVSVEEARDEIARAAARAERQAAEAIFKARRDAALAAQINELALG